MEQYIRKRNRKFIQRKKSRSHCPWGEQQSSRDGKESENRNRAAKELHTNVSVKTVVTVFAVMLLIIYFCVNEVIKKTLKLEPIRVLSMIE